MTLKHMVAITVLTLLCSASRAGARPAPTPTPNCVTRGFSAFRARHPEAVHPGQDVSVPEELSRVSPKYPPELTRKRRTGASLIIPIVVAASGAVTDAELACPTQPNHDLAPYAVAAIRQWRYKPALRAGKPIPVFLVITVTICVK